MSFPSCYQLERNRNARTHKLSSVAGKIQEEKKMLANAWPNDTTTHTTNKSALHQKKRRSTAYKNAVRGKQSSPRLLLIAAFESFHAKVFQSPKTQPTRHFPHNVSRREHVKVFPGPANEVESVVLLSRQAVQTNMRAALTYCLTKRGKAVAAGETNLNKTSCRFTLRCQAMPRTLHHALWPVQ